MVIIKCFCEVCTKEIPKDEEFRNKGRCDICTAQEVRLFYEDLHRVIRKNRKRWTKFYDPYRMLSFAKKLLWDKYLWDSRRWQEVKKFVEAM